MLWEHNAQNECHSGLTREKFKQFSLGSRLHFGKRKAVVAFNDDSSDDKAKTVEAKSEAEIHLIKEGLKSNVNLRNIMSINDEQLDALCAKAYKMTGIKKNQVLIQQGDLFADKWDIEVKVFPNPSTNGNFTLQLDRLQADESLEIVVYNLIGKKIQSFHIQPQAGYFQQEVNLGYMAKGIYMLQIVKGDQKITKRLSFI